MTTSTAPPRSKRTEWLGHLLAGLRTFWDRGRRVERVAYVVGAVLIASGLFHLVVFAVDGGPWQGPVSWRKPVTFGLSFGMTLVTATWVMSFLRLHGRLRAWLLGVFSYTGASEVFGITLQRWRGEPSHFNEETAFNDAFNKYLASGAVLLVLFVLTVTVLNLLPRTMAGVPASMRLALRAGWVALLGAMAFGVLMVVTATSHLAAPGDDAAAQQAAYTSAGWLKPAHAITMHAILVLPVLAWLASHLPWPETRRFQVVAWATAGYAVLAAVVVGETLARVSPLATPLWACAVAAAGAGTLAGAAAIVLIALVRGPLQPGLSPR